MAHIDEIKESIGYLKVIFSILIAVNVSLVAWIYKHYDNLDMLNIILFFVLSIVISLGIIHVNRTILHKIRSLRNL